MKIRKHHSIAVFFGLLIWACAAHAAHAETRITNGYIYSDTIWQASGSPYMIEDTVTVPDGVTLSIEPGATVIGASEIEGYPAFSIQGYLNLLGQLDGRVSLQGFGGIVTSNGTTSIRYADIALHDGLNLLGGHTSISSSTISGATYGIYAKRGDIEIVASRIFANAYGIYVKKPGPPVYQERSEGDSGYVPSIKISGSSMTGNDQASVYNEEESPVYAAGNWWGSADGPGFSGPNKIAGPVEHYPWLKEDPYAVQACCSSVLFLPGLEASRLYNQQFVRLMGTTTNKLWEPLSYENVRSLYLDAKGSSTDPTIFSDDVVDIALYTKGIYYKFIKYMNGLVGQGLMSQWKPFAYDWRQPIDRVVRGLEKRATSTESLIEAAKDLAAHSKTGRITIIAHSNGGLVGKYLVKALAEEGKSGIVDKFISVAVPYLGTPEAILSLLHGTDQSIAFGLILKESIARGLAANMPSAYSLLPSAKYYEAAPGTTIAFSSTTIASHSGQSGFILGTGGNSLLMSAADAVHDVLDTFIWPAGIAKWAIIGWNKETASGMSYSEKRKCLASIIGLGCSPRPVHEKLLTSMGDGTVVASSASYDAGTVAAIDLKAIASENVVIPVAHSSMLESSTTLALIDFMIRQRSAASSSSALPSLPGVSSGRPDITESSYIAVGVHAPAELHVYDSLGRHTGAARVSTTSDIYDPYESGIPDSAYYETGDGDSYAYLPDDGKKYSISIKGTGVGEMELDVARMRGSASLGSVQYIGVPVTPLTEASTTLQIGAAVTVASGTSPVVVDEDGDGKDDAAVKPNQVFDPISYLEMYKKTISAIAGSLSRGKALIGRIDRLEELIKKGRIRKVKDAAMRIDRRLRRAKLKKLSDAERQIILDQFDAFIQRFEP